MVGELASDFGVQLEVEVARVDLAGRFNFAMMVAVAVVVVEV